MNTTVLAVSGALAGALVTAATAMVIAYYQRTGAMRDAHRLRAFERHLTSYEQIFTTCRSMLDALNDYLIIDRNVDDRSDPFLIQLLEILRDRAYRYCIAVDWRHNAGMAYLELKLEETCLHLRDLLLEWLSLPRIYHGNIITIKREGNVETISPDALRRLDIGAYEELRIERLNLLTSTSGDAKLIHDIRAAGTSVIKELKEVMAY
jgi:hypothetical protein